MLVHTLELADRRQLGPAIEELLRVRSAGAGVALSRAIGVHRRALFKV